MNTKIINVTTTTKSGLDGNTNAKFENTSSSAITLLNFFDKNPKVQLYNIKSIMIYCEWIFSGQTKITCYNIEKWSRGTNSSNLDILKPTTGTQIFNWTSFIKRIVITYT